MKLKTIALAVAFALTSSFAVAQGVGAGPGSPAPIGSSADTGNGASLNRGPDAQPGVDRNNRSRSGGTVGMAPSRRVSPGRTAPDAGEAAPAGH
jgi:hypothetical protein